MDKQNSRELEQIMEQRKPYRYDGGSRLRAAEHVDGYYLGVAAPILSGGDLMGCVMSHMFRISHLMHLLISVSRKHFMYLLSGAYTN